MSAKRKMVIVVFEGLDKSGKHTQSRRLYKLLKRLGYKVVHSSFHRYDTPTGQLVQQWLYRQYPVDNFTIELIMSADKQAQQGWFAELEEEGVDFLILDRYVASQICYSTATGLDPEWVTLLSKHLRKPDLEIFIDVTPAESMRRKGKHGENDRYESDKQLLTSVRNAFLNYFSESSKRIVISDCDNTSVTDLGRIVTGEVVKSLR
jgi:dTMP kinase